MASFNGHAYAISILLDNGADVNALTTGGSSCLHYASFRGHIGAMVILVSKGAKVNVEVRNKAMFAYFVGCQRDHTPTKCILQAFCGQCCLPVAEKS
jgi:ankyrin repeat protein